MGLAILMGTLISMLGGMFFRALSNPRGGSSDGGSGTGGGKEFLHSGVVVLPSTGNKIKLPEYSSSSSHDLFSGVFSESPSGGGLDGGNHSISPKPTGDVFSESGRESGGSGNGGQLLSKAVAGLLWTVQEITLQQLRFSDLGHKSYPAPRQTTATTTDVS